MPGALGLNPHSRSWWMRVENVQRPEQGRLTVGSGCGQKHSPARKGAQEKHRVVGPLPQSWLEASPGGRGEGPQGSDGNSRYNCSSKVAQSSCRLCCGDTWKSTTTSGRARGAAGSWPGGDGLTTLPCAHGALGGSRLWEHLLGVSQIVVPCVLLWTWASINTI